MTSGDGQSSHTAEHDQAETENSGGDQKADAIGEKRREGLDQDSKTQIGGTPDDPDGNQTRSDGGSGRRLNTADVTTVATIGLRRVDHGHTVAEPSPPTEWVALPHLSRRYVWPGHALRGDS